MNCDKLFVLREIILSDGTSILIRIVLAILVKGWHIDESWLPTNIMLSGFKPQGESSSTDSYQGNLKFDVTKIHPQCKKDHLKSGKKAMFDSLTLLRST